MDSDFCKKLTSNYCKRLTAVIANNGHATKYLTLSFIVRPILLSDGFVIFYHCKRSRKSTRFLVIHSFLAIYSSRHIVILKNNN